MSRSFLLRFRVIWREVFEVVERGKGYAIYINAAG